MAVQMNIGYNTELITYVNILNIFLSLPKMVIINMEREKVGINLIVLEVSK